MKIICPFTSGSGADVIARHFGERLSVSLRRPVIVDNKTGGNGVIAVQALRSQPPDGSTILLGNVSIMAINPVLYRNLGYQPAQDFLPLSGVYRGSSVFAVHPGSQITSLEQLVARAKQAHVSVGSYSPGYRLAAEYLAGLANVKFTDVPYRGQAPLLADLMGGQMDAAVLEYGGAMPSIQAGRVRALAITSEQRHPQLPDLPTVKELGYPEYYHYGWTAFFAHPQTPAKTAQGLTDAISATLRDPGTIGYIHKTVLGEPMPLAPGQLSSFIQTETDRFARVARAAGMEPI
ncbi:Bug family tripartite tricarboxylate transporter substrate binding protein [Pseudorhodoferax soli]|uniref:Bug family tripartite tricarboxylate transporter substrate binding protein n=1 Tax=Pseudorhodoferax soli TaxID=545864 RepID=UPI0014739458|nr:tripartite tricarboxylate transporter substrate binding protein [Pseudorhodoferax soli]